jgi:uroporphyrinogen-III synthase
MSDNATAPAPLVLLTRPRDASERFAAALRAQLGPVAVVIVPLMKIVPTGVIPDLAGVATLIFTSAAGVEVFAGLSARRDLPAWCVGARTADAAQAIGLFAHSAGGDADALVAQIIAAQPQGRLVHLCGVHSRGAVAERLTAAGLPCAAQAIYDQTALGPNDDLTTALAHSGPVFVPLFSPRSAALFASAAGSGGDIIPVALSDAVRAALPPDLAARALVADSPDAPAMIRAIAGLLTDHSAT